jgi:branched-chain amino acid transport system substrate-binding protein
VFKRATTALALTSLILGVSACGSSSSNGSGGGTGPIVIGASLPLSGPEGAYGPLLEQGYQYAVGEVNATGGLSVGSHKRKAVLKVLDNQSNPSLASQQARTLIVQDGAVGLLGGLDNTQNVPISSVADQLHVPMVTHFAPIRDWLQGNPGGWKYSWDIFFDEAQASNLPFQTANSVPTNHKVALFINNGTGATFHRYYLQRARQYGYTVVEDDSYPLGTTDFTNALTTAKGAGAQVVVALGTPPDGFALWKQMKALNYQPKIAFCDLCANTGVWAHVLGPVADDTSAFGWWSPSFNYPGTAQIVSKFEPKLGDDEDLTAIVGTSTAAEVLLDAISAAGGTNGAAVNAEIAKTDKTYTLGPIKFGTDHVSVVPVVEKQWQSGSEKIVYPSSKAESKLQDPVAGL